MLLKVESFSSGSDQFPELLHFLKPAVQLDGCSAEELVRRPLHCVRVVFCKKRNLILQHLNLPPPFRIWWNPLHHFGRNYDEKFITYTSDLFFQLYTAEKQVFCPANKTFILLWCVLRFYSQCQFVCAQWHANVHFISSIFPSKQLCLDNRVGSRYVWFLNLRSYNS